MALKSKRLVEPLSKTGIFVEQVYCRKCMQNKLPGHFMTATDLFLDSNGYMSVCKECIDEMFDKFMITEATLERTLLKMCRTLNVKYDEKAIKSLKLQIKNKEEKDKEITSVFGTYKARLFFANRVNKDETENNWHDFTFYEPTSETVQKILDIQVEDKEYLEKFWGSGLTPDDYECLEEEFYNWGVDPEKGSYGEKVLVKEICHIQNNIRKARIEGKSVESLVKSMQDIMKNSALTPALQNAATSDRNVVSFGKWIRDIETTTPAEWFEDQQKYRDMDGLQQDIADIHRSIGNFMTGSRDFNTSDLQQVSGIDEEDILPILDEG